MLELVVLDSSNPIIVIPALLSGFLVNPAWYLWLGLALRREQPAQAGAAGN